MALSQLEELVLLGGNGREEDGRESCNGCIWCRDKPRQLWDEVVSSRRGAMGGGSLCTAWHGGNQWGKGCMLQGDRASAGLKGTEGCGREATNGPNWLASKNVMGNKGRCCMLPGEGLKGSSTFHCLHGIKNRFLHVLPRRSKHVGSTLCSEG